MAQAGERVFRRYPPGSEKRFYSVEKVLISKDGSIDRITISADKSKIAITTTSGDVLMFNPNGEQLTYPTVDPKLGFQAKLICFTLDGKSIVCQGLARQGIVIRNTLSGELVSHTPGFPSRIKTGMITGPSIPPVPSSSVLSVPTVPRSIILRDLSGFVAESLPSSIRHIKSVDNKMVRLIDSLTDTLVSEINVGYQVCYSYLTVSNSESDLVVAFMLEPMKRTGWIVRDYKLSTDLSIISSFDIPILEKTYGLTYTPNRTKVVVFTERSIVLIDRETKELSVQMDPDVNPIHSHDWLDPNRLLAIREKDRAMIIKIV